MFSCVSRLYAKLTSGIFVFIYTGVLQLMEIGDVQRKDIMDHPENYTMLTTLDEG